MPSIPPNPQQPGGDRIPIGQIPVNPNFLFFAPDDFGREYLRVYNKLPVEFQILTPNINKLVQEGVTFTRAYSQPLCSPSRAAWLTGRHGWQTGIGGLAEAGNQPLVNTEVCLPTALKIATDNTYITSAFGKWHLSDFGTRGGAYEHPIRCGFDHFEGHLRNLEAGESYFAFEGFTADPGEDGSSVRVTRYPVNEWSPKYFADRAASWIREQQQPWLCYFAANLPHTPYNRPPAYAYDTDLYDLPDFKPPSVADASGPTFFKAMVQGMDWSLGYLLNSIPQAARSNTVIIFWSDNGTQGESFDTTDKTGIDLTPYLGTGYAGKSKRTVYELGVNIPMIVSGPNVAAPGRTSSALVSPVDLFRTVIELAGGDYLDVPLPSNGTRTSLSFDQVLTSTGGTTTRTYVPVDTFSPNGPNVDCTSSGSRALAFQQYKLIRKNSTGTTGFPNGTGGAAVASDEFYDLAGDPNEVTNLIAGPNPVLTGGALTAYQTAVTTYGTAFSSL